MIKLSILLFISFFLANIVNCQEVKFKEKISGNFGEEYSVLKENKKIKHGGYIKYKVHPLDNRSLLIIGQFKNDKKEGKWYYLNEKGYLKRVGEFHDNKKHGFWRDYYTPQSKNTLLVNSLGLSSNRGYEIAKDGSIDFNMSKLTVAGEGNYLSGSKVGIWNFYTKKSEKFIIYDYSKKELLFPDSIEIPLFNKGNEELIRFLANTIKIPSRIINKGITGETYMQFEINKNGNIENITFLKSVDEALNKELRSAILKTCGEWIPSNISYKFVLPVLVQKSNSEISTLNINNLNLKGTKTIKRLDIFIKE